MPKPVPGQRYVVGSFHPNPFPVENCPFAPDGLNGGLMVRPMVFRTAAEIRKFPREAGRFYEAEFVGHRDEDRAPTYRAITRLRISRMDELELGGREAPGIEEAVDYIDNGAPLSQDGISPGR